MNIPHTLSAALRTLSRYPLLVCALLLAAQTLTMLDARALWWSDEVRYGNVLQEMLSGGHWLVLHLNGEMYPDKPPIYFWLLSVIAWVWGAIDVPVFMLGAAVSAVLMLAATIHMSRRVAGMNDVATLTTGLVLVGGFYFAGLAHYSRMDLLFAAAIVLAQVCFFRAVQDPANTQPLWRSPMAWGFVLCGVATLIKGPFGLALPILGLVLWCAWTARLSRLMRRDAGIGLLVLVAILLAWALGSLLVEGKAYMDDILYKQVYRRAMNASHHDQPWWHYLVTLPIAWLPWTLLPLAWLAAHARTLRNATPLATLQRAWAERRQAGGVAYCVVLAVGGFLLLSAVSTKIIVYLLPLFGPLAVLTARALMTLDQTTTRRFAQSMAGLLALVGVGAPLANFFTPWPIALHGLWLTPLVLLPGAALFWWLGSRMRTEADAAVAGPVLALVQVLVLTVWLQPVGLVTAPSLDAAMSPRAQALVMRDYIEAGHQPMAYKIYSATYTYYAGADVFETQDIDALTERITSDTPVVLGMQKKYWERFAHVHNRLDVVHEQWIVDRPYILAVSANEASSPPEVPTENSESITPE